MKVLASKFVFVVIFVMYFVCVYPGFWIWLKVLEVFQIEYPLC